MFFITLAVLLLVTVSAAAQSGHGGSTRVIARIEPPSSSVVSEETQPDKSSDIPDETSSGVSQSSPAATGDNSWAGVFLILLLGSALTAAFAGQNNQKKN